MKTLHFDEPVSEEEAVRAVEDYLSKPLSKKYFEKHYDAGDTDHDSFEEAIADTYGVPRPYRGILLCGQISLASLTRVNDDTIKIECDS